MILETCQISICVQPCVKILHVCALGSKSYFSLESCLNPHPAEKQSWWLKSSGKIRLAGKRLGDVFNVFWILYLNMLLVI